VGEDRAAPAESGEPRPALARQSRGARRDPLGPSLGGEVAGPSGAVSELLDVLETVAPVGGGRNVAACLACVPVRVGCARAARLGGGLHRRKLRAGEKRGSAVGKTKRGKGTKWMVVVDGQGVPLGSHLDSASPAEVTLVDRTLANVRVPRKRGGWPKTRPQRLIADRGYDSDPLRAGLGARSIELIAPHRSNRVRPPTQDGRALRRYRKRWKMERTFAWLGNFRRLVVRWERDLVVYRGFFHLACAFIVLRHL
jgi:transposase